MSSDYSLNIITMLGGRIYRVVPAKGRAKRAEQGHHRRADDHLSTENYVKFVVLFNIADGFPCFHG